jgi:uncharacterized protein with HEPN domain
MRRDLLYLQDIVEACQDIAEFLTDVNVEAFRESKLVRSAVIQKLMVVGEAASRLSNQFRESHSEIAWNEISAFRNRIVHGYFQVDWDIVWIAASEEAPELLRQAGNILAGMDAS